MDKNAHMNKEAAWEKTASWDDVRDKAMAIVTYGGVEIYEDSPQQVGAYVMSGVVEGLFPVTDGGPYEVILSKKSWENKNSGGWLAGWLCGCVWGSYHSGSPGHSRFSGRLCSHAYATLLVSNTRARSDFMGDRTASIKYNKDNFYEGTKADWYPVNAPEREPDYVSESGSMYWHYPEGVVRGADHWGNNIGDCNWHMLGDEHYSAWFDHEDVRYGFCPWDGFESNLEGDMAKTAAAWEQDGNEWNKTYDDGTRGLIYMYGGAYMVDFWPSDGSDLRTFECDDFVTAQALCDDIHTKLEVDPSYTSDYLKLYTSLAKRAGVEGEDWWKGCDGQPIYVGDTVIDDDDYWSQARNMEWKFLGVEDGSVLLEFDGEVFDDEYTEGDIAKCIRVASVKEALNPMTFAKDSDEYFILEALAESLNWNCPNCTFVVEDGYFDYGQDWKWTSIVAYKGDESWWALNPAEWERAILTGDVASVAHEVLNGDYSELYARKADKMAQVYNYPLISQAVERILDIEKNQFKNWGSVWDIMGDEDVLNLFNQFRDMTQDDYDEACRRAWEEEPRTGSRKTAVHTIGFTTYDGSQAAEFDGEIVPETIGEFTDVNLFMDSYEFADGEAEDEGICDEDGEVDPWALIEWVNDMIDNGRFGSKKTAAARGAKKASFDGMWEEDLDGVWKDVSEWHLSCGAVPVDLGSDMGIIWEWSVMQDTGYVIEDGRAWSKEEAMTYCDAAVQKYIDSVPLGLDEDDYDHIYVMINGSRKKVGFWAGENSEGFMLWTNVYGDDCWAEVYEADERGADWFVYRGEDVIEGGIEPTEDEAKAAADEWHAQNRKHAVKAPSVKKAAVSLNDMDFDSGDDCYRMTLTDESGDPLELQVTMWSNGWDWLLKDSDDMLVADSDGNTFFSPSEAIDDFNDWTSFNASRTAQGDHGYVVECQFHDTMSDPDWGDYVDYIPYHVIVRTDSESAARERAAQYGEYVYGGRFDGIFGIEEIDSIEGFFAQYPLCDYTVLDEKSASRKVAFDASELIPGHEYETVWGIDITFDGIEELTSYDDFGNPQGSVYVFHEDGDAGKSYMSAEEVENFVLGEAKYASKTAVTKKQVEDEWLGKQVFDGSFNDPVVKVLKDNFNGHDYFILVSGGQGDRYVDGIVDAATGERVNGTDCRPCDSYSDAYDVASEMIWDNGYADKFASRKTAQEYEVDIYNTLDGWDGWADVYENADGVWGWEVNKSTGINTGEYVDSNFAFDTPDEAFDDLWGQDRYIEAARTAKSLDELFDGRSIWPDEGNVQTYVFDFASDMDKYVPSDAEYDSMGNASWVEDGWEYSTNGNLFLQRKPVAGKQAYLTPSGVFYNVTDEINPAWQGYDLAVAQGQMADYELVFTDEWGEPIDDEYVIEEITRDFEAKRAGWDYAPTIDQWEIQFDPYYSGNVFGDGEWDVWDEYGEPVASGQNSDIEQAKQECEDAYKAKAASKTAGCVYERSVDGKDFEVWENNGVYSWQLVLRGGVGSGAVIEESDSDFATVEDAIADYDARTASKTAEWEQVLDGNECLYDDDYLGEAYSDGHWCLYAPRDGGFTRLIVKDGDEGSLPDAMDACDAAHENVKQAKTATTKTSSRQLTWAEMQELEEEIEGTELKNADRFKDGGTAYYNAI